MTVKLALFFITKTGPVSLKFPVQGIPLNANRTALVSVRNRRIFGCREIP